MVPNVAKPKMFSIIDIFVTKHYERLLPDNSKLTNKLGNDLAILLNYGSSAKDLKNGLLAC